MTNVRHAIRRIEEDGWVLAGQRGSHRQCKHPTKAGRVTIAGQPNKGLHPKTYRSILSQEQLENQ